MSAMRAGASASDGSTGGPADLLAAAASLRWSRPDLTWALADHVLAATDPEDDTERWVAAAGWAVHARSATGDGREVASDVLDALGRHGAEVLGTAEAHRLRVELALVAIGAGEIEAAKGLLEPVLLQDTAADLRADAFCALARCAVEDAPEQVAEVLEEADACWSEVDGPDADLGSASVALVAAAAERRTGRAAEAVELAADGLARLERGRGTARAGTPSAHLAAALAAEWVSALLDDGRTAEARESCARLAARLTGSTRPSRQLARLRLTVAGAMATGEDTGAVADALHRAARDAADCDAPELESVCRTALGALHEKAGELELALEALRMGLAVEQRHQSRGTRFRTALAVVTAGSAPEAPRSPGPTASAEGRATPSARAAAAPADRPDMLSRPAAVLPGDHRNGSSRSERESPVDEGAHRSRRHREDAPEDARPLREERPTRQDRVARDDRPRRVRNEEIAAAPTMWLATGAGRPVEPEPAGDDPTASAWDLPWSGAAGESPIGELLMRSLRSGEGLHGAAESPRREPGGGNNGSARRSGPSPGDEPGAAGSDPPAGRGGWRRGAEERGAEERGEERRRRDGAPTRDAAASRGARAPDGDARPAGGPPLARRNGRTAPGPRADDEDPAGAGAPVSELGRRWTTGQRSGQAEPVLGRSGPARPGDGPARPAPYDADPESWLQAALADLDRMWGRGVESEVAPAPPSPSAEGCVVAVDIARDGRRFAGKRAAGVLHIAADLLIEQLPPGARLRNETDALSVVLPGWSRTSATGWMRRTMPGLLAGREFDDDLQGMQLRATVHDADGPVGAQLLQRLDAVAPRDLLGGEGRPGSAVSGAGARRDRSAAPDRGPTNGAQRPRQGTDRDGGARDAPAGRHGATGRSPSWLDGLEVRPGSGGRRHRRPSDEPAGTAPELSRPGTRRPESPPAYSRPEVARPEPLGSDPSGADPLGPGPRADRSAGDVLGADPADTDLSATGGPGSAGPARAPAPRFGRFPLEEALPREPRDADPGSEGPAARGSNLDEPRYADPGARGERSGRAARGEREPGGRASDDIRSGGSGPAPGGSVARGARGSGSRERRSGDRDFGSGWSGGSGFGAGGLGERGARGRGHRERGSGERGSGDREPGDREPGDREPGDREPGERGPRDGGPDARGSDARGSGRWGSGGRDPDQRGPGEPAAGRRGTGPDEKDEADGRGTPEGGSGERGTPEGGSGERGPRGREPGGRGSRGIGSDERAPRELGSDRLGSDRRGSGERASDESAASELGLPEFGSGERGSHERRAGGRTAGGRGRDGDGRDAEGPGRDRSDRDRSDRDRSDRDGADADGPDGAGREDSGPDDARADQRSPDAAGRRDRAREPVSTDGLGLADLLAGALAAYRNI